MAKTITIAGCGNVGRQLAIELENAGYDVAVADTDEKELSKLKNTGFSGVTVIGVPFDRQTLENAGIEGCDFFIAATDDDNTNIAASQAAKEFFSVENVLTCISDVNKCRFFDEHGLAPVSPTQITIGALRAMIDGINLDKTIYFGAKTFSFSTRRVTKDMVDKKVSDIPIKNGETVFAVMHDETHIELYNPGVKIRLAETDSIIIGRAIDD